MVDHLFFKIFCASLQPLFKVPCRNTVKRDILAIYDVERKKIQKGIDSNKGRIAITTDMWTATNQKRGYMAITGHYIDNGEKLRNHLLSFAYVPAPHTSTKLATVLRECLMAWNVDSKLSTITLDNCSTNDALIEKIKRKLGLSDLIMHGSLVHMRCSAHVLNLIVKDGLYIIKEGIDKVRDSVVYWTATPRRVEFFEEAAKQKNITFSKKLVLDCPTRWNSTFHMLSTAIPYKDVFVRLRQREPQYTSLPSATDWSFAAIVCQKLEVLSKISVLFSGDQYPTSNLFFPKICDLKLKLMEWKYSELDHYLDEDVVPRSRDIEFDILGWWRANAAKYATLHEIARDILAVPISSVASESAFSAGERLLDPHRSRLHFKTVEALMCTRSWIKDGICKGTIAFNISLLCFYVNLYLLTVSITYLQTLEM
ncbi:Putative AC transposase [Linum grandiflorum]